MTKAQITQFNMMLGCLRKIAKGYQTPDQLRRNSEKMYGLDYEEALGMSYENIQADAAFCCKGIREIKPEKQKEEVK